MRMGASTEMVFRAATAESRCFLGMGAVLRTLLGTLRLTVTSETDLLASAHAVEDGLALHLFNIEGTLPDHALLATHDDIIETFAGQYKLPDAVQVRLIKPDAAPIRAVTLSTPEGTENLALDFTDDGHALTFTVPAGVFGGYALIEAVR